MFGQKKSNCVEVWRGSSGNTGPVNGTYEEVMSKAYKEKSQPGVTKVIVRRDGKEVARL
jgi:hypothetical protein